MTLPPASTECFRSFWLVVGLGSGFTIALVSFLMASAGLLLAGLGLTVLLVGGGLLWPRALSLPYRAWNRLASGISHLARLWVMGICFYLVLVAVGRAGSSLRLHRPGSTESLWMPRGTLVPDAYGSQHAAPAKGSLTTGWISSYLSWTVQTRNFWACFLLPFFILLSALESEQESTVSTDLYTLF